MITDIEFIPLIQAYDWKISNDKRKPQYCVAYIGGTYKTFHKLISLTKDKIDLTTYNNSIPDIDDVYHINKNILDNRLCNLSYHDINITGDSNLSKDDKIVKMRFKLNKIDFSKELAVKSNTVEESYAKIKQYRDILLSVININAQIDPNFTELSKQDLRKCINLHTKMRTDMLTLLLLENFKEEKFNEKLFNDSTKSDNRNKMLHHYILHNLTLYNKYIERINTIKESDPEFSIKYINKNIMRAGKTDEHYFTEFKNLVEDKNGKCLSTINDYKGARDNLKVECENKHMFTVSLNNLKKDRWCPTCKIKLGELIAVNIIEYLLDKKFVKIRPDWLKNENGNNLELDGYNEELKIAIEYQGIQHYKFSKYFFKTEEDFEKRRKSDAIKVEICKNNGITLIVIPYYIPKDQLCEYIGKECIKLGYDVTEKIKNFDLQSIVKNSISHKRTELLELIKSKNGELLSDNFVDRNTTLTLLCDKGHIWETKAGNILRGLWCAYCGVEMYDEKKNNISQGMIRYSSTSKGKEKINESHAKKSVTMAKQKAEHKEKVNTIGLKICTKSTCDKANEEQPLTNFNKKSDSKDGYQPWCKLCVLKNK